MAQKEYPLTDEELKHPPECVAEVPAEKLQALADYHGEPKGEEIPEEASWLLSI